MKMPSNVFESFSKLPANVSPQQYRHFVHINYLYFLAFVTHAFLLIAFSWLGVTSLIIFNIGSCITFLITIKLNLRGYFLSSITLGAGEVICHTIFCSYVLGWESGFQYYLLGVVVAFFAAPIKNHVIKIGGAVSVSILYIILSRYLQHSAPAAVINPFIVHIFSIANLWVFVGVISLAIYGSGNAIAKAEDELANAMERIKLSQQETEKKNQELTKKNQDLIESNQRADRIFSALAKALPGTVLDDKYRLDEQIGSGGFGTVFKATHLSLNRLVAVKIFRPMQGNDSAKALERFRLEGVSACRINHPNAIAVLDSGVSMEGIAYLVMELLNGNSLANELSRKSRLSLKRTVEIIIPICDVLWKAHSVGIIHRDIKPDNIFLHKTANEEVVKVVDFGIAKLLADTSEQKIENLTGTGGFVGTPTYMAPERFDDAPYDGKADVYSVGVLFYQMLCGIAPYQSTTPGVGGSWGQIHLKLTEKPKPPSNINPNIPALVEAIIMRSLEIDPDDRPTAKELAIELSTVLGIKLEIQDTGTFKFNLSSLPDQLEEVEASKENYQV
jgi:serine/threonine protein kinase